MLTCSQGLSYSRLFLTSGDETNGGARPPPKGLIKATFTYLLHFVSFLDETCQIDYGCWSNDIKVTKADVTNMGYMQFLISKSNLYHLKELWKGNKTAKTVSGYDT